MYQKIFETGIQVVKKFNPRSRLPLSKARNGLQKPS